MSRRKRNARRRGTSPAPDVPRSGTTTPPAAHPTRVARTDIRSGALQRCIAWAFARFWTLLILGASAALAAFVLRDGLFKPGVLLGSVRNPPHYIWNWWWWRESILALRNPFFTTFLHHPLGVTLVFDAFAYPDAFLAFALWPIMSPIAVYDTVAFIEFVWTGVAAYLFFRRIVEPRIA